MYKRLMFVVFILAGLISLIAQENDSLPEKYVPKVIIEAEWGDGPGEFGVDLSSAPYTAPGGIDVDKQGNIYILDNANGRIQKFDNNGRLLTVFKVNSYGNIFGVKQGRVYSANVFRDTLEIISTLTQKKSKVNLNIPNAEEFNKALPYGYVINGELTIFQPSDKGRKKWKLQRINTDARIAHFKEMTSEKKQLLNRNIKIKSRNGTSIEINRGAEPDIVDSKGNYYFKKRISSDTFTIVKTSSRGNLLSKINYSTKNYIVDACISRNPIIDDYGNVYYLYPTGELKIEDWEQKFIPGKVQVIKWELQK